MSENNETYWGMPVHSYCTLIHLSQLSSMLMPGLGFVVPIVMWLANKDKHDAIDRHGKITVNWLISFLIYAVVFFILAFVLIGILGFFLLMILNFVFAIIAAVKANNGQEWAYPFSIKFFK